MTTAESTSVTKTYPLVTISYNMQSRIFVSVILLFLLSFNRLATSCSRQYNSTGHADPICSFCPAGTFGTPAYGCQPCGTNQYSFNGLAGSDCSTCPSGTTLRTSSRDTCIPSTTITDGLVYHFSADAEENLWAYRTSRSDLLTFVSDRFGREGRALRTTGGYLYAPCSPNSLPAGNAPRTLSVWFKLPTLPAGNHPAIVGYGMNDVDLLFSISHTSVNSDIGRQLILSWYGQYLSSNVFLDDDTWHFVAVTHNGLLTRIFVDGVNVVDVILNRVLRTMTGCYGDGDRSIHKLGPFLLFSGYLGETRILQNGTIDDVRIYSRALQSSEIDSLFRATTPTTTVATVTSSACQAGTFSYNGMTPCSPCPPGTYSEAVGSQACILCPAGTFGDHAGLSSAACSGACATCTAGSTTAVTYACNSKSARSIPTSVGLQLLAAAHPQNLQKVDLVIAPLSKCQQVTTPAVCGSATTLIVDGITYAIIGTAEALNMEAAETLICNATV